MRPRASRLTSWRASPTTYLGSSGIRAMPRAHLAAAVAASLAACGGSSQAAPPVAGPADQAPGPAEDKEAWAKSQGLLLKKFDLNRDERPDIFKFYRQVDD